MTFHFQHLLFDVRIRKVMNPFVDVIKANFKTWRQIEFKRSGAERASEAIRAEQAQPVSGASERANGRASGPVLRSVFLVVIDHSVVRYMDCRTLTPTRFLWLCSMINIDQFDFFSV